jgi:hypothetical protein
MTCRHMGCLQVSRRGVFRVQGPFALGTHAIEPFLTGEPIGMNLGVGERDIVIGNHQVAFTHFEAERSSRQAEKLVGAIPVLTNPNENF